MLGNRTVHKRSDNLKSKVCIPQMCSNNMIACLSFQESDSCVKTAFSLKNLAKYVKYCILVF